MSTPRDLQPSCPLRSWTQGVNADRVVHTVAGTMLLLSLALAHWHSPYWLWLTLFVSLNLFQSGLTNWCLGTQVLVKLGAKTSKICGV